MGATSGDAARADRRCVRDPRAGAGVAVLIASTPRTCLGCLRCRTTRYVGRSTDAVPAASPVPGAQADATLQIRDVTGGRKGATVALSEYPTLGPERSGPPFWGYQLGGAAECRARHPSASARQTTAWSGERNAKDRSYSGRRHLAFGRATSARSPRPGIRYPRGYLRGPAGRSVDMVEMGAWRADASTPGYAHVLRSLWTDTGLYF